MEHFLDREKITYNRSTNIWRLCRSEEKKEGKKGRKGRKGTVVAEIRRTLKLLWRLFIWLEGNHGQVLKKVMDSEYYKGNEVGND